MRFGSHRERLPYEHDVTDNSGIRRIFGCLAVFWGVVVFLFFGPHVHVPWYFWIFPVIAGLLIGVWWLLNRPWHLVAETTDPPEHWAGIAIGRSAARAELRAAERSLRTSGNPGRSYGLLESIDPATPTKILSWPLGEEET
jgi:hypothetical protein